MRDFEESEIGQNLTLVIELKLTEGSGLVRAQNFTTILQGVEHLIRESGLAQDCRITIYSPKDGSDPIGDTHFSNGSYTPITD